MTKEIVGTQVRESLAGISVSDAKKVIVAYEPVWAIGPKALRAATPEEAQEMHVYIRGILSDIFGKETADGISIIYGGSVKSENSASYIKEAGYNGLLVGGASLNAEEFIKIVKSAR